MSTSQSMELLDQYIRARKTVIAITTHEEERVMDIIKAIAGDTRVIVEWSYTTGLRVVPEMPKLDDGSPDPTKNPVARALPGLAKPDEYKMPIAALDFLSKYDEKNQASKDGPIKPTLFVFKDLHRILESDNSVMVTRYLREISMYFQKRKHNLILISPNFDIPSDMDKNITMMDWPLPDLEELSDIFTQAEMGPPANIIIELGGRREEIISSLQGLTFAEAQGVLKLAMVATKKLSPDAIQYINMEKEQIVKKSGILEYFHAGVTMDDVGGLGKLKEYSRIKRAAFSKRAREAGVPAPKGVLLVGVPGGGKSLAAKAIAGADLPLLRLDVGALMGSLLGQSEANTRMALKIAESISPCVFWWDEIEKALGGTGAGNTDGGTSLRVLGTLLTWMQENKLPVYVVATANSTNGLRPELLRRFDDVMFVDLPDMDARKGIFKIHLRKHIKGEMLPDESIEELAAMTWSFSGSEIEKVVNSAVEKSFCDDRVLSIDYLRKATADIVPLSVTSSTEIEAVRTWAKERRAVAAGNEMDQQPIMVATAGTIWDIT